MSGKIGSASFGVLLVDGYDVLASKVKTFTHKVTAVQEKSDGLGDLFDAMTPTGVVKLEVSQGGAFFDDSTNGVHALLSPIANLQVSRLLVAAFAGNAIGKAFLGISGLYGQAYAVLGAAPNLTKADVTYQVSGTLDRGAILMNQAAQTATWTGAAVDYTLDTSQRTIPITSNSIANPSVVTTPVPHGLTTGQVVLIAGVATSSPTINGQQTVTVISPTTFSVPVNVTVAGTGGSFVLASTVNGGAGYQAISAYASLTGVVGKIQHSADNASWADLSPSFTNVTTAPLAERIVVAAGTTVNRYLRHIGTVTGSGSITPFAGFSRA